MRRTARGFNLVSVLVASALAAVVAVGFIRFFSSATRGQANLAKQGEATQLDSSIRALLMNKNSCLRTATGLDLSQVGGGEQSARILDGFGGIAFEENQRFEGIIIEELKAQVAPLDGGVHLVRFRTKLTKNVVTTGGKASYEHVHYVNVVVDGAVAKSCFYTFAQDTLTLLDVQPVVVYADADSSVPRLGIQHLTTLPYPTTFGVISNQSCTLPRCTAVTGPWTPPFTAKGNLLALHLSSVVELVITQAQAVGTGVAAYLQLEELGGATRDFGLGAQSMDGATVNRFISSTHITDSTPVEVKENASYRLRLGVNTTFEGTSVGLVGTASTVHGSLAHYYRAGAP